MIKQLLDSTSVNLRQLALFVCIGLLPGCAALTSEMSATLERRGEAPSGVHYSLPMARLNIKLSVDPERGQFTVTAGALEWLPDPQHRYYIQHRPLPQFEDDFTIQLNTKGTLLKQVTLNTTDKTVAIAYDLGRAFGGFGLESATRPDGDDQLDVQSVDPTDGDELKRVADRFNQRIRDYADRNMGAACKEDRTSQIVLKKALCEEYGELAKKSSAPVSLAVLPVGRPLPEPTAQDQEKRLGATLTMEAGRVRNGLADCRIGICYRPPQAFAVEIRVQHTSRQHVVLVPNRSPLVEIDLYRTFLASGGVGPEGTVAEKATTHTIIFSETSGLLESLQITKNSELLALANLPLAITQGIIAGLALRLKVLQNEVKSTNMQRELIEQRALLAQQMQLEAAISQRAAFASQSSGVASQSRVPALAALPARTQTRTTSFVDAQKPLGDTK
jgi:hypothetical protein